MSAVNLSPTWLGPGIQLLHWCNNMSSLLCCRELTFISINFGWGGGGGLPQLVCQSLCFDVPSQGPYLGKLPPPKKKNLQLSYVTENKQVPNLHLLTDWAMEHNFILKRCFKMSSFMCSLTQCTCSIFQNMNLTWFAVVAWGTSLVLTIILAILHTQLHSSSPYNPLVGDKVCSCLFLHGHLQQCFAGGFLFLAFGLIVSVRKESSEMCCNKTRSAMSMILWTLDSNCLKSDNNPYTRGSWLINPLNFRIIVTLIF